MPRLFSRVVEIHYEGKLENALKEIKTASSPTQKKKAENNFFDLLCEISSNYRESRSKRLAKRYDDLYEDYRLEQRIETSD